MSSARKRARRAEIEIVRANARASHQLGFRRNQCPYRYSDQYQWENEWDRCEAEAKARSPYGGVNPPTSYQLLCLKIQQFDLTGDRADLTHILFELAKAQDK